MKRILSLLLGISLLFACRLDEIEDLSELTEEEQIELFNTINEPRDISYMLDYELDSLPMDRDSVIAVQVVSATREGLNSPYGQFNWRINVYECDTKQVNPRLFNYLILYTDGRQKLNLKNALTAYASEHEAGKWLVGMEMETDTLYTDYIITNPCGDGRYPGFSDKKVSEDIFFYGFTEEDAKFVARQLNKFIPQIKEE